MRLVFGPSEPLRSELQQAAHEHRGGRLQLAVAWVNEEGAGLLADATSGDLGALEAVVGINNQGTTVEGLLSLLASADSLRVLYQHPMMTFHPKAYCFDDGSSGSLLVGSSNMTAGGLDTNFEASIVLDLTPDLREQWGVFWSSLQAHPFSFLLDSHVDVEKLYKGGYISLEAQTRARRRRLLRRTRRVLEGDSQNEFDLPTQGPTRRFRSTRARVEIPFDVVEEQLELPGLDDLDSESGNALDLTAPPSPARTRVFVRTLTANDVAKLHGARGDLRARPRACRSRRGSKLLGVGRTTSGA